MDRNTVLFLHDADQFRGEPFDPVVSVCDSAAEECSIWLPVPRPEGGGGPGRRARLGFPDPAKATGNDEEIMSVFRNVRDDLARQALELLRQTTTLAID